MLIIKANFDALMPAMKNNKGRNNIDSGGSYLFLTSFVSVYLKNFMNLNELSASNEIFDKFP
jgi:hypothetical protein